MRLHFFCEETAWRLTSLVLYFIAAASSTTFSLSHYPALTGVVSGNKLWQGIVFIAGDVVIEKTARLVIAPGTEVVFLPPESGHDLFVDHPNSSGSELIVHGTLIAEGTADKPITFRYIEPMAPAGSWGGIALVESPEARFRYVHITQANNAIHSYKSKAIIEESWIENNLFGIRFNSTDFLIRNNLLRGNDTAIRFHFGAPVILNNIITENNKGFFITSYPKEYRIQGNNIVDNHQYAVALEAIPTIA